MPAISAGACAARLPPARPARRCWSAATFRRSPAATSTAAFRLLGAHDLVFGPAADGGFWLVGARRRQPPRGLFERVRWSGPHALADTLAGLPRRTQIGFVETLEDVDDANAYRRLRPRRGF